MLRSNFTVISFRFWGKRAAVSPSLTPDKTACMQADRQASKQAGAVERKMERGWHLLPLSAACHGRSVLTLTLTHSFTHAERCVQGLAAAAKRGRKGMRVEEGRRTFCCMHPEGRRQQRSDTQTQTDTQIRSLFSGSLIMRAAATATWPWHSAVAHFAFSSPFVQEETIVFASEKFPFDVPE